MWVAVHVFTTFKSDTSEGVLLEENVVLMQVDNREDALGRLEELKELYGTPCVYPGFSTSGELQIRKIVSVSNLDGNDINQPNDKTEITYELLRFQSEADVREFVSGKSINAKMVRPSD